MLVNEDARPQIKGLRVRLWMITLLLFLGIAVPLWVFEMNFCEMLLPFFTKSGVGGATFHIVWHIGAGTSSYVGTVLTTVMRLQNLDESFKIDYLFCFLPIITLQKASKNK